MAFAAVQKVIAPLTIESIDPVVSLDVVVSRASPDSIIPAATMKRVVTLVAAQGD